MLDKFLEPLPKITNGFWEPHTSSIDFCETNYFYSQYIVEVHNVWSSIMGLSSFGVLGLIIGNCLNETRNTIAYLILIFIGIGSAGLHGSLHWLLQSADELPMMYLILSLFYLCGEYDAKKGVPNYPRLPHFLSIFAFANTVIYYCFQQLYLVFLLTFISQTTILIKGLYEIVYKNVGRSASAKRINNIGIISMLFVAIPCWLFDMLCCKKFIGLTNSHFFGVTPHVLWHYGAGFAAHCAIVCLECCRMDELDVNYKVTFFGGIFPLVKRVEGAWVSAVCIGK